MHRAERIATRSRLGDLFDRTLRALRGLPDVTETKPATKRAYSTVIELAQTFIVHTLRQSDGESKPRDHCFLEYVDAEGSIRIVLPPEVCDTIARQRDALGSKNRKKAAKREAARRTAAGIKPGFLKTKE